MKKRGGVRALVSWIVVLAMIASTITIGAIPTTAVGAEAQDGNGVLTGNEIIPGQLEKTFLKVTDFYAGAPVVYMNQDNFLYITIESSAGSVGDEQYTSSISLAITDIETLTDENPGNPKVILLEKAINELEEALDDITDGKRVDSIQPVLKAIVFLKAASNGHNGIDTENIVFSLANAVKDKVGTVIDEAEHNFGSESPDAKLARLLYNQALDKLEREKYPVAMGLFEAAFETVLNAYECNVNLTVIDIIPGQSETIIGQPTIESLSAETDETVSVTWHPTQRGIHYVKLSMTGVYEVYASPGTTAESPPIILSLSFAVSPQATTTITWGPGGFPTYNADNVINDVNDPEGIREISGTSTDDIKIEVYEGLTIESTGTLILNEYVKLVMIQEATWPSPIYDIVIDPNGVFQINSPLRTTMVKTPEGAQKFYTYPFLNSGTIDFTGASVTYTYGDKTVLTDPGGIQNKLGSTCMLNNVDVIDADTHSLYVESGSSLTVKGVNSIIGSAVDPGAADVLNGHGIFVNGATPVIEDVTVQYHMLDGIRIENSVSEDPILAADLENYASSQYDFRLTYDPDTSTQPIVAAGNGAVYMVYLNQESNKIYFKKSVDQGATWSEPLLIYETSETIEEIDLAADGDNIAIVWGLAIQGIIPGAINHDVMITRSSDGGATWSNPLDMVDWGVGSYSMNHTHPAVDIEGNVVYIIYKSVPPGDPAPLYWMMGITIAWGSNGDVQFKLFLQELCDDDYPDIAVDGNFVHIVWAKDDGTADKQIYYRYSIDGLNTLEDYGVIDKFQGNMEPRCISVEAKGNKVYFLWADSAVGNYEIYGKSGEYIGEDWNWWLGKTPITTFTGDSQYPQSTVDSISNWHIVWQDDRDAGVNRIRYSRLDKTGEVTQPDTLLTPDTTGAYIPTISIDSTDHAYLVWEDESIGNSEVYIKRGHQLVINGAEVLLNNEGIAMESSSGGIIVGNDVEASNEGINLYTSNQNILAHNTVSTNDAGIYLDSSDSNTITNNTVLYNQYGMYFELSDSNTIYHNNFLANLNQAYDDGTNFWDNGYPDGGNYWSDYTGADDFSGPNQDQPGNDGIGDDPYTTATGQGIQGGTNEDDYPLMRPAQTGEYFPNLPIRIDSNADFDDAHGVTAGNGIEADPWIIEKYNIDGTGYGYCIYIGNATDYFVVRNCYLHDASGVGTLYSPNAGVTLYTVSNGLIDNNIARSNYDHGIYLIFSDDNVIKNNINIAESYDEGADGIRLDISNSNIIANNTASNMPYGYGISIVGGSKGNTITNNTVSNNDRSIRLSNSNGNTISNNTVSNSDDGIHIGFSNGNTIVDNMISNNGNGICLFYSGSNTIVENTISSNSGYGIYSTSTTNIGNTIYHNNIINNNVQAYDNGDNFWDNGYPVGGNYWNDYTDTDIYSGPLQNQPGSDGIWDNPYTNIGGTAGAVDNYPLVDEYISPMKLMSSYWKLDETTGEITAVDSIGDNDGSIEGATNINQPGWIDTSYSFPNANDCVRVPDDASLNFHDGQDFSIFAWVKTTTKNDGRVIEKRGSSGDQVGYSMYIDTNGYLVAYLDFGAPEKILQYPLDIADGNWHHVGIVREGDVLYAYVDNARVSDTGASGDLTNIDDLYIGNDASGTLNFDGNIDDVQLYRYALPWYQIGELYYVDSDGDGMSNVFEEKYGEPNGGWQDREIFNDRYGLIIVCDAGKIGPYTEQQSAQFYWNDAWRQYKALLGYGLDHEHIVFAVSIEVLNKKGGSDPGEQYVDYEIGSLDDYVMNQGFTVGAARQQIMDDVGYAFQHIGEKMGSNDCLYQIWIGHGDFTWPHDFVIDDNDNNIYYPNDADEVEIAYDVSIANPGDYSYIQDYLSQIITYTKLILVFHPCYSGGVIPYVANNYNDAITISSCLPTQGDNGFLTYWNYGFSPEYGYSDGYTSANTGDTYGVQDGEISIYEAYCYAADRTYYEISGQKALIEDTDIDGTSGTWYQDFSTNPPPAGEDGHISVSTYFGELRL